MSNWRAIVAHLANDVETHFDHLAQRLQGKLGSDDTVSILPYNGYGTPDEVFVRGRVLRNYSVTEGRDNDTVWQNLLNMYRRFNSHELSDIAVRITLNGQHQVVRTDEEGFFDVHLPLSSPLSDARIWHPVDFELAEITDHNEAKATGQVMIPPRRAQFGIISDIDDTVIKTDVLNLVKLARNTFLNNAHTRLPFPGVAEFYSALQRGTQHNFNPVFYVSNSPWNLYDLLTEFFMVRNIPLGAFFLTDLGFTEEQFLRPEGREHKLAAIERILSTYPDLPFILIGDSGEIDAEIYLDVIKRYPGRILTVYIRDVSSDARDKRVVGIGKAAANLGTDLHLIADTLVGARHAAEKGLIVRHAVESVRIASERDQRQTNVVERLTEEPSS